MTKKIAIVIYTVYGHVYKLSQAIQKGIQKVAANNAIECSILQVPETLSPESKYTLRSLLTCRIN